MKTYRVPRTLLTTKFLFGLLKRQTNMIPWGFILFVGWLLACNLQALLSDWGEAAGTFATTSRKSDCLCYTVLMLASNINAASTSIFSWSSLFILFHGIVNNFFGNCVESISTTGHKGIKDIVSKIDGQCPERRLN